MIEALRTREGHNLGTLSVIDRKPREVSEDELATLTDLAGIVVDELEVRLAARDEHQRLNRTRTDFVAIAAHELRTPLAAVYGAAKLLEQVDLRTDVAQRRLLAVITEESERLAAIVDELLTGAQLDAGRVQIVRGRVRPLVIANSALDAAGTHLPKNLSFQLATDGDPPEIESDAIRVKQILASLLDNAIKYSPGGGRIDLAVTPHNGGVRFRISDQGIGIPPDEAQHIFERFVRLDREQTRGVGGTGLGLYIARELASQLGGWITYEPNSDTGSTFVLDLPLGPPPDNAHAAAHTTLRP